MEGDDRSIDPTIAHAGPIDLTITFLTPVRLRGSHCLRGVGRPRSWSTQPDIGKKGLRRCTDEISRS